MLRTLLQTASRRLLLRGAPGLTRNTAIAAAPSAGTLRHIGLSGSVDPSTVHSGTMAEIKAEMVKRIGIETGYNPIPQSREHLSKYEPKMEDLPPRSMQDSFTSATIPLSTDLKIQDKYVSHLGRVRIGRLMEDMDMMAVWICHKHLKVPNLPPDVALPYTFVTILVDKVDISEVPTLADADIRLSGHVSWVGRSSMEIVIWMEQLQHGKQVKITRALFLMAARNATNTGAAPVNPIEPKTDEERTILAGGEDRKKRRHEIQAASIFKVEPNDAEQTLMYDLFKLTTPPNTMQLNQPILPANSRWMSDSSVSHLVASFPEHRNAHNKVFGGFLMRSALEISWLGAFMYCKNRPLTKHICDISFEKPVPITSYIRMDAYVVYTEANYIQMMTVADVIDGNSGTQVTSNVFYYTFTTPDIVPTVLPKSYHETLWYIQGRRKFKYSLGLE